MSDRESLCRSIAECSRQPMPETRAIYRLLGNDGNWYGALGVPSNVTLTGASKVVGYAVVKDNATCGQMMPTAADLVARHTAWQDRNVGEFYQQLLTMTDDEIASQREYWFGKAKKAA